MKILAADENKLKVDELLDKIGEIMPDSFRTGTSEPDEIISLSDRYKFDVIFTGIRFPEANGIEIAEKILDKYPRTNIIYITGFPEYALESYKTYASAFLVKPVTSDMLRDTLANLRYPVSNITDEMIQSEFAGKPVIGRRIQKYREERGMTRHEFAESAGVALQTVYRWENGKRLPDIATYMKLLQILGIKYEEK